MKKISYSFGSVAADCEVHLAPRFKAIVSADFGFLSTCFRASIISTILKAGPAFLLVVERAEGLQLVEVCLMN